MEGWAWDPQNLLLPEVGKLRRSQSEYLDRHFNTQLDVSSSSTSCSCLLSEWTNHCSDHDHRLRHLRTTLMELTLSWISPSFRAKASLANLKLSLSASSPHGTALQRLLVEELPRLALQLDRIHSIRQYVETTLRLEALVGDLEDAVFYSENCRTGNMFTKFSTSLTSRGLVVKEERLLQAIKAMNDIEEILVNVENSQRWHHLLVSVDHRVDKTLAVLRPEALAQHRALLASLGWPPKLLTSKVENGGVSKFPNPLLLMHGDEKKSYAQSFHLLCALQQLHARREARKFKTSGQQECEMQLWAIDELVSPLAERMEYHFLKWTEQPEFIFALVYRVTRDFMEGVSDILQPLIDAARLMSYSANEAWVSAMVHILSGFLTKNVFPTLAERYKEKDMKLEVISLWLNLVDLIVGFDKQMQSLLRYETCLLFPDTHRYSKLSRGMSVLVVFCDRPDWLKIWARMELKDGWKKLKAVLKDARAWQIDDKHRVDFDVSSVCGTFLLSSSEAHKAPPVAESALKIAQEMMDRCETLPVTLARAKFVRSTVASFFWYFSNVLLLHCKNAELSPENIDDGGALVRACESINAARYIESKLQEWSDDVSFLEMKIAENNSNIHEKDKCFTADCFFGEEIKCLAELETNWLMEVVAVLLRQFENLTLEYNHHLDDYVDEAQNTTPNDDPAMSDSLIEALHALKNHLNVLMKNLNRNDFLDLWRSVAQGLDHFMCGSILASNVRFSRKRSVLFAADMQALFLVFQPFCARPQAFFPCIRDILKVLTMSGEEVKQLLVGLSSEKSEKFSPLSFALLFSNTLLAMDVRRLAAVTKPIYIYTPITRPLTCVTSSTTLSPDVPQLNPQRKPPPSPPPPVNLTHSSHPNDRSLLDSLSSILCKPFLDSSKSKQLLPLLSPSDFDRFFFALSSRVNPKTTLNFFSLASRSFNFHFTLWSYCVLILLLLLSNNSSAARLLLIRLIDGKLPLFSPDDCAVNHIQIASALADLDATFKGVAGVDLLLHLYCTQFKNVGFTCAVDVFFTLADKGIFPSSKTCNFFLNSLVKANELQKAHQVFETLSRSVSLDVYLCTCMINGFCKGGRIQDALALFSRMENLGISPNVVTYNNIIHGLCKSGRLDEAFQIKQNMTKQGVDPSLITYSVLINGLIKLDKFGEANSVLKEMSDKGFIPNEFVYNTLIAGYCKMENMDEALKIMDRMVLNGMKPNSVTFNSLMLGFCRIGHMERAENLLREMLSRGLSINIGSFTSVIHWLCLKSRFDSALHFTTEMLLRDLRPNDGLMTMLVSGLCKDRKHSEAIELWFKLFEKGFPANIVTSNALIHGLCEAGKMQEVIRLVKEMSQRNLTLDRVSYNTLILGCCKEGKVAEAFRLKEEMFKRGIQPDIYTYNLLIHCISNMGKMEDAVKVWDESKRHGMVSNVFTYAILIDGYCTVDQIEECQNLFNELVANKLELNTVIYNTMIKAYCKNGNMMAAFQLRDDMKSKGILPNIATYSSLIHGMCKLGLPDDASQLIVEMRDLGLLPNVICYTTLVGGYCRLGQMDKARSLIQEMSSYNVQPNKITYTVMIVGYCKLGNMREATKLLTEMIKNGIVPDAVTYNAYMNGLCKEGRVDDAFRNSVLVATHYTTEVVISNGVQGHTWTFKVCNKKYLLGT
ncbi:hypothetical protein V6N13_029071 [Hibiscus sabdariffa]|uniref:Pentatricopeptide repeat-containing protein n=1 Tax=Hibiscus sabdariffa TaxID=183260 RepID=A0ABR2ALN0_9ROSI